MDAINRNYPAQENHPLEEEVLTRALESFEGAALKFSADAISDARQRDLYNRNVKRVREQVLDEVKAGRVSVKDAAQHCYEMRNKIMAEIRGKTSPPGRAIAESRKAVSPALEQLLDDKAVKKYAKKFVELGVEQKNAMYYEIVESSARPNTQFNTANQVLKVSGKVLIVVTIAYAAYEIASADNKTKAAIKQGAAIGGGVAGTVLAGLAVSTVCGPGAPICTLGFLLGGGLASGWAASELADAYDAEIEEFSQWAIH